MDDVLLLEPAPPDTGALPISAVPATGPIAEPASERIGVTTASPAVGRPGAAVRTSDFLESIEYLPHGTPAEAETPLFARPIPLDAVTRLTGLVALAADAAPAILQMTIDGLHYYALNGGQALPAGAWVEWTVAVPRGAQVNWQFSAATTIGAWQVHGST